MPAQAHALPVHAKGSVGTGPGVSCLVADPQPKQYAITGGNRMTNQIRLCTRNLSVFWRPKYSANEINVLCQPAILS
jgi:hypothetical protein